MKSPLKPSIDWPSEPATPCPSALDPLAGPEMLAKCATAVSNIATFFDEATPLPPKRAAGRPLDQPRGVPLKPSRISCADTGR